MNIRIPHVKSKTLKNAFLLRNRQLKKYVPTTRRCSFKNLTMMLRKYGMVYVKPDNGRYGRGVMKVQKLSSISKRYRLHYRGRTKLYGTFSRLYIDLRRIMNTRRYIVQRGISLLTVQGRPFDIRVMVQQNPAGQWETTGILARIAGPKQIVTNFHSGGTPQELEKVLSNYMSRKSIKKVNQELSEMGIEVAEQFVKHLKNLKEIGVDVALDPDFQYWILEVNTRPDAFVFKQLKKKSIFRKIYRYARRYGKY